jgi:hypothetical protein
MGRKAGTRLVKDGMGFAFILLKDGQKKYFVFNALLASLHD